MIRTTKSLIDVLPVVRGRYLQDVEMAKFTWFQVGGIAEVTYKPADPEDLGFFLKNCPSDIPIHIIGVGSNLLVRDGGVPGVVVRLGGGFTNVHVDNTLIYAGAAVLDRNLAFLSQEHEVADLEFLCGIPGTLGGALRMNAGAYGTEMSDILKYALVMDRKGNTHRLTSNEMGFGYRKCSIEKDWIFIGACLEGQKGHKNDIENNIRNFLEMREITQPVHSRTGGSTFANPEHGKAWELIDRAGCRGLKIGGAMISEMHCNFMINTGSATAEDLENLGEVVRKRVYAETGVNLRWEIERIGNAPTLMHGVKAA